MKSNRGLLDGISTKMSILKEKLIIENAVNDLSLNIHLEQTYLQLTNLLFGYDLKNANLVESNHAAVDGVDREKGIYVQVTSTFSLKKILHTIKKLHAHELSEKCQTLLFVFLKDRKRLTEKSKTKILKAIDNSFDFDFEAHLLDNTVLYEQLALIQDRPVLEKADELLDHALGSLQETNKFVLPAIGITFSDLEVDKVSLFVQQLLRCSVSIYTTSYALIRGCEALGLKVNQRLLFISEATELPPNTKFITILSNEFIHKNLIGKSGVSYPCVILNHIIKKDRTFEAFTFDYDLRDREQVVLSQFKDCRTYDLENDTIHDIVEAIFVDKEETSFNIKDYKKALIKQRTGFTLVNGNKGFNSQLRFHHYKFKMDDYDEIEVNYIIVERGYNQTLLIEHFRELLAQQTTPYTFLLPKNGLKTDERIMSFKRLLHVKRVHFLDDYLFDELSKKVKNTQQLEDESFVNPIILNNGKRRGLHDILHWITENSESTVAILAGTGGIGKTTVCEKIQHDILEIYERYVVIFIEPTTFIDAFAHISFDDAENYDLYNVYQYCNKADFLIEEDIFNINLQAGNIVIIFDGIDEVISTLESFNINHFLDKIARVKKRIGKGKILINIRDTYIEDLKSYYDSKNLAAIEFFDLQPFNKTIANNYFQKRFPQESKKTEMAIALLDDYTKRGGQNGENEYLYRPFVLECICSYLDDIPIIESSDLKQELYKFDFDSKILVDDITDFIIFNVCKREIIKKGENGFIIDVDDQVHFMILLAIEEKGLVEQETIKALLRKIGIKDRITRVLDSIKDHPFLFYENERFKFRFSFLKTHFEAIALHKLIVDFNYFDNSYPFIDLLANRCSYNSLTFKNIQYRISKQRPSLDELIFFAKGLIDYLNKDKNIYPSIKEKAISNLFVLLYHFSVNMRYDNTELIKDLFGNEKGIVQNFFLIDVPLNSNIILDFTELIFEYSKIENYGHFFNCTFSEDTFFSEDCEINKVLNNTLDYRLVSAQKSNFDANIKGDNSIHIIINLKQNIKNQIEDSLRSFLKCFVVGNSRTVTEKIKMGKLRSCYSSNIDFQLLLDFMLKNGIVLKTVDREVYLQKSLLRSINKYISQGIEFRYQKKVVTELMHFFTEQELNAN